MDDISSKITGFLEDEKNVELLKTFANMMKSDKTTDEHKESSNAPQIPLEALSVLGKLSGGGDDDRVRLIKALRPFVNDKRKEGLDTLTKILSLSQLLPLLSDNLKL